MAAHTLGKRPQQALPVAVNLLSFMELVFGDFSDQDGANA